MEDPRQSDIVARPIVPGDGTGMLAVYRRFTPMNDALAAELPGLIDALLAQETIIGGLVETVASGKQESRVLAAGLTFFLSDDVIERYLAAPFPFLWRWLLEQALQNGSDILLDRESQAAGNSGDGVNAVPAFCQDSLDYSTQFASNVMAAMFPLYLSVHQGYRLKRLVLEAEESGESILLAMGHAKLAELTDQDPWSLGPDGYGRRAVYGMTREHVHTLMPGSTIGTLFVYRSPRFSFSPVEQRVLSLASSSLTDEEIARQLEISRDAVKQQWRAIYEHVGEVAPDIVADSLEADGNHVRGREKRRKIISYVRDNVQELRPHMNRRKQWRRS